MTTTMHFFSDHHSDHHRRASFTAGAVLAKAKPADNISKADFKKAKTEITTITAQTHEKKPQETTQAKDIRRSCSAAESSKRKADEENEIDSQFSRKLTHVYTEDCLFKQHDFTSLLYSDPKCSLEASSISGLLPEPEYDNRKAVPMGEKSSYRLYEQNNKIYYVPFAYLLNLLQSSRKKEPQILPDGMYNYVIVLKDAFEFTPHHKKMELRVAPAKKSGHALLLRNPKEAKALLAAGEFYIRDKQCIFASDKSGHYNLTKQILLNAEQQEKIFRLFFKPNIFKGRFYAFDSDENYNAYRDKLLSTPQKAELSLSLEPLCVSTSIQNPTKGFCQR